MNSAGRREREAKAQGLVRYTHTRERPGPRRVSLPRSRLATSERECETLRPKANTRQGGMCRVLARPHGAASAREPRLCASLAPPNTHRLRLQFEVAKSVISPCEAHSITNMGPEETEHK